VRSENQMTAEERESISNSDNFCDQQLTFLSLYRFLVGITKAIAANREGEQQCWLSARGSKSEAHGQCRSN
jgi:hypothetical protein